jgi:hypothetical protein
MNLEEFLEQERARPDIDVPVGGDVLNRKRGYAQGLVKRLALEQNMFSRELVAKFFNQHTVGDHHVNSQNNLSTERCKRLGIRHPDMQRIVANKTDMIYFTPAAVEKLAEYFHKRGVIGDYKQKSVVDELRRVALEYSIP